MWTKTISFTELKKYGRWKVELFTTSEEKMLSAFEMVKIGLLVRERKENIKPYDFPDENFNYIGLENVTPLTGELINFNPKKGNEIKSTSRVFYKGDILYGRLRPYLNKVYLAIGEVENGICSGEFHVLQPDFQKIMPHYLRTVLSSSYIQNYVKSMQTGSALPRLSIRDLLAIEIPVPPLEIQQEFENYIIEKTERLRELRREINALPNIMISKVVHSLETGSLELS
ncbi:restriction endonuclease subunit S [Caldifermentibacillus hisashii]|uniref:Type I restriction modification DNA specificity protein n=1 Tax=Tepidibacillus fermentans TaxID=1281767 RepID=A0A4R3KCD5_9BACI|nr:MULTISPECIES: restriction endonuclease subunit S [Bacillaceae]MED4851777.1 restriction endonuclease subunit S [Caldifermentibacillus hisashii]TCS80777.1 type I restriction modification DNA specificity protein [Tepidibacillus fermentans]